MTRHTDSSVRHENWAQVMDALIEGDAVALAKLNRLVTNLLSRWRAFDFRAEWDDVAQEVVVATLQAYRAGRLDQSKQVFTYLRRATRNRFIDCVRRENHDLHGCGSLDEAQDIAEQQPDPAARDAIDRLRALPEPQRLAIVGVCLEGRTYEEAARTTGIPLGSLKRYLRQGLLRLEAELAAA